MPAYVLIVDVFGLVFAVIGYSMAFRQTSVRRLIGRPRRPTSTANERSGNEDPLTYILRISGVMVMVFAVVIAGMVTMFNMQ